MRRRKWQTVLELRQSETKMRMDDSHDRGIARKETGQSAKGANVS